MIADSAKCLQRLQLDISRNLHGGTAGQLSFTDFGFNRISTIFSALYGVGCFLFLANVPALLSNGATGKRLIKSGHIDAVETEDVKSAEVLRI